MTDTRAEIVDRLWEKVEPMVFITKAEFVKSLDGWAIAGFSRDGRVTGVALTKGAEFHFASLDDDNRFSMRIIASFLQPIIDRHGFVRTRTPKDDLRQQRFNRMIGFEVDGESEFSVCFRMERLRGRRGECR